MCAILTIRKIYETEVVLVFRNFQRKSDEK